MSKGDLGPPGASRAARAALLAGTLVLTTLAYRPALSGEFQFDDTPSITDNPRVKEFPRGLGVGFLASYRGGRPLTELTYAIDHAWSGADPRGYHVTGLALHLAATLLAYALTRLLFRRAGLARADWLALASAALFALHPLQTQAVAYLAQRSEVLSSLLYLAALLLLFAAERQGVNLRGLAAYFGALLAFALALGAKPIAATLPLTWLLLRHGLRPASREGPRIEQPPRLRAVPLLLSLPLFAGAAAMTALNLRATAGHGDAGFDIPSLGPPAYLLTQTRVVARYLRLLAWPAGQNLDYDFPVSRGLFSPPATLPCTLALLVLLASAAALWLWARHGEGTARRGGELVAVGVAWFCVLLLPSSSFVPLADLIEEHRVYLASLGLFLTLPAAAASIIPPGAVQAWRLAGGAAVAAALALALALHGRAEVWSSKVRLWSDAAEKSPKKARPHMNYGHALSERGRLEEAVVEYRAALELEADGTVARVDLLRNLGSALIELARVREAVEVLRAAAAAAPGNPDVMNNLAVASIELGELSSAEKWARYALRIAPDHGAAHNTLGEVHLKRGDFAAAYDEFRVASDLDPDNAVRRYNLGAAAGRLGRREEACRAFRAYEVLAPATDPQGPPVAEELRTLGCGRALP